MSDIFRNLRQYKDNGELTQEDLEPVVKIIGEYIGFLEGKVMELEGQIEELSGRVDELEENL